MEVAIQIHNFFILSQQERFMHSNTLVKTVFYNKVVMLSLWHMNCHQAFTETRSNPRRVLSARVSEMLLQGSRH